MKLKLLADQCVPNSTIQALRDDGWEVLKFSDYLSEEPTNRDLISKALELDCVLLTHDRDLSDIVADPQGSYNGIIALQVRNHPENVPHIVSRLKVYLSAHPDSQQYKSKLLAVAADRVTVQE